MAETQKRQVALKVKIADILESNYVKEEGWEPNYMELLDKRKCSRANIIGVVIEVPESTEVGYDHFTIDDGSGSIMVRVFENTAFLKGLSVGAVVLIIGRPRQYQDNKYIVPEIVRKIDNHKWVQVRKLELENQVKNSATRTDKDDAVSHEKITEATETNIPAEKKELIRESKTITEEKKEATESKSPKDPYHEIIEMIRDLDKGDGADIEEITSSTQIVNSDTIIESLLREGEIFELRPGRLKVLE